MKIKAAGIARGERREREGKKHKGETTDRKGKARTLMDGYQVLYFGLTANSLAGMGFVLARERWVLVILFLHHVIQGAGWRRKRNGDD